MGALAYISLLLPILSLRVNSLSKFFELNFDMLAAPASYSST